MYFPMFTIQYNGTNNIYDAVFSNGQPPLVEGKHSTKIVLLCMHTFGSAQCKFITYAALVYKYTKLNQNHNIHVNNMNVSCQIYFSQ